MMVEPNVSIIVPFYNEERNLGQCIRSLLSQTMKNIEIICVNDGSTDTSEKIIWQYAENDNRIKVINQSNRGLSAARNAGVAVAKGEYITFVDSDDWIDATTCERMYDIAISCNADIVMCSYVKEFKKHSVVNHLLDAEFVSYENDEFYKKIYRRLFGPLDEELRYPERIDLLVSAWGQLFHKNIVREIMFVDTDIIGTEDLLFQIQVYCQCKKFVYIDEPFYHYRRSEKGTLTTKYMPDKFERWQVLYDLIAEHIRKHQLTSEYECALMNRIALSMVGLGLNETYADKNLIKKSVRLRNILQSQSYRKAFQNLDMQYFPIHWKIFFLLCKYKCTLLLVVMLECIEFLRTRIK